MSRKSARGRSRCCASGCFARRASRSTRCARSSASARARTLLQDGGLVIDAFDNSTSRRLVQDHCRALELPCLHAGLYADYGEVIWDERYGVPRDVAGDVCDYPLARNLVLLVVAVASEVVLRFALRGHGKTTR